MSPPLLQLSHNNNVLDVLCPIYWFRKQTLSHLYVCIRSHNQPVLPLLRSFLPISRCHHTLFCQQPTRNLRLILVIIKAAIICEFIFLSKIEKDLTCTIWFTHFSLGTFVTSAFGIFASILSTCCLTNSVAIAMLPIHTTCCRACTKVTGGVAILPFQIVDTGASTT